MFSILGRRWGPCLMRAPLRTGGSGALSCASIAASAVTKLATSVSIALGLHWRYMVRRNWGSVGEIGWVPDPLLLQDFSLSYNFAAVPCRSKNTSTHREKSYEWISFARYMFCRSQTGGIWPQARQFASFARLFGAINRLSLAGQKLPQTQAVSTQAVSSGRQSGNLGL